MLKGEFKTYEHNPPHLFVDDCPYMITAAVYDKKPYLSGDWEKGILFEVICEFCQKFKWELVDWVILDNHYHLILKSRLGTDLSKLMGGMHRKSANLIKKKQKLECKRFWWNYWDTCPKDEKQLYAMRNYVQYNPVKHGVVKDLKDYRWSSFISQFEELGREEMEKRFRMYRFQHLKIRDDF